MLSALYLLALTLSATQPLDPAGWTFSPGPEFPGAQGSVEHEADTLTIHYDFTGGGNYVAAYHDFEATPVSQISFLVRKPPEARLTFRVVDETGQSLQKSLTFAAADWQRVEVLNSGWTGHWGGANNGRVNGALHNFGVLVESGELRSKVGSVALREVVVHDGAAPANTALTTTYRATDFRSGWGAGGPGSLADGVWTYQLDANATEAWLSNSISLFGEPRRVTLRADGGLAGQVVRLKLGSHFQTFERELGELTGGPVELTVPLPPDGDWRWYGGENDGQVHRPLRLATLVVAGPPGAETTLHDLSLEVTTETAARDAVPLTPQPAQRAGAGLSWRAELVSLLPEAVDGVATLRLSRWSGEPVAEQHFPLRLSPGQQATLEASSEARPEVLLGRWTVSAGPAAAEAEASWVPPVEPAAPGTPAEPDSPWGMGVYLYRYGNDPRSLAEMDRAAGLAAAAGIRWTREEFQWHRLELREGEFDWSFYDNMVQTAQRHGLSVYGLLAYWASWSDNYTLEGIDQYCRWAQAVVGRYKDRIKHWEIWNEPNIFFWSGPKELYPVLLTRAYAAIKAVDPEAVVLGCSTAGIDIDFIRRCVEAGAPFDELTVHPYRGTLVEDGFVAELRAASEAGRGVPVWITEMGWPTQLRGGVSEAEQARLLARCYLSAVGSGAVVNMGWYNYRDDGVDRYYNETNFGIIRRDFSPKPAYQAMRTIATRLAGARDGTRLDLGPGWQAYRFTTADGPAVALWPEQTALVRLDVAPGARLYGLMDDAAPADGEILAVAQTPLIVTGTDRVAVAPAGWTLEVPAAVRPGQALTLRLTGDGLPADAQMALRDGLLGEARGERELTLTVPRDLAAGRYSFGVELQMGGQALLWPLTLEVLPEVVRG